MTLCSLTPFSSWPSLSRFEAAVETETGGSVFSDFKLVIGTASGVKHIRGRLGFGSVVGSDNSISPLRNITRLNVCRTTYLILARVIFFSGLVVAVTAGFFIVGKEATLCATVVSSYSRLLFCCGFRFGARAAGAETGDFVFSDFNYTHGLTFVGSSGTTACINATDLTYGHVQGDADQLEGSPDAVMKEVGEEVTTEDVSTSKAGEHASITSQQVGVPAIVVCAACIVHALYVLHVTPLFSPHRQPAHDMITCRPVSVLFPGSPSSRDSVCS